MVVCGCPNPPCRWALNWAHVPQNVRCDNLYDAALDKTGVSIWAISWTQRIELQPQQVLEAFTTLSANWGLAEAVKKTPVAEVGDGTQLACGYDKPCARRNGLSDTRHSLADGEGKEALLQVGGEDLARLVRIGRAIG